MSKVCCDSTLRQYLVILIANLSGLCLGLSVAWSSPMLVKLKDGSGTGLPRPITDEEDSWIASIGILASWPILFTIGFMMDRIGRQRCLLLACIPRVVGCLILTFATEVWMVLLGRAIDGFAIGTAIAVVATYSSEIASKEIRGALGMTFQVASATGMLISFGVAPFLPYFYVNVMYLCIAVAVCIPIWLIPESPYYLYSKGRKEESVKVLTYLRASSSLAHEEIKQYELSLNEAARMPSKREIFLDSITLKTLGKVIFMSILFELIGYNAVLFYVMPILKMTQTTIKDEIGSVVIGCIQLLASFVTILLTDKWGRKPILIATLCGMAVGMIGLATFFQLKAHNYEIRGVLSFIPLLSIVLVLFSFNAGIGSLLWTLVAELFDSYARAIGVSAATFTAGISVFLTIKYFVSVINTFGPVITFGVSSVLCIVLSTFILFCIPETKGKTFLEIQMELGRNIKLG